MKMYKIKRSINKACLLYNLCDLATEQVRTRSP